jgi:hypothetical protein
VSFGACGSEFDYLFESGASRGEIAALHGVKTLAIESVDLRT